MLARGPLIAACQRNHLSSPDANSCELVAAGNNLNFLVPINGILQEVRVRLGVPTPFYLDSLSSVCVSNNDASAKKSVWLRRRAVVLHEGVGLNEICVTHIVDPCMVADVFTKYLPYPRWRRHMWYLLNMTGPAPPP